MLNIIIIFFVIKAIIFNDKYIIINKEYVKIKFYNNYFTINNIDNIEIFVKHLKKLFYSDNNFILENRSINLISSLNKYHKNIFLSYDGFKNLLKKIHSKNNDLFGSKNHIKLY